MCICHPHPTVHRLSFHLSLAFRNKWIQSGHYRHVLEQTDTPLKGRCAEARPVDVFQMGVMTPAQRASLNIKGKIKGFVHGWKQIQVVKPEACRTIDNHT